MAKNTLAAARKLSPEDATIPFYQGLVYLESGDPQAAERILRDLRSLDAELAGTLEEQLEEWEAQTRAVEAAALPASPFGPGWEYATTSDNSVYWLQTGQARSSGGIVTVWYAAVPKEGKEAAFDRDRKELHEKKSSRRVVKVLAHTSFDCSSRRIRTTDWVDYDDGGSVLNSVSLNSYEANWAAVIPNSIGEGLLEAACSRQ